MKGLTDSMSANKESREKDYLDNTEMRDKITNAIDSYKEVEEDYKAKMTDHNKNISDMQDRL